MRKIVLVFFGAFSLNAVTIPGSFKQIDCEGGGWLEQVIPHSSGRLYARTDVGGMYRSDDHGDTWQFISGDMPNNACYYVQGVAIAAGNADVVYQADGVSYASSDPGRGVWKSTDGGTTWTHVLSNVNFSGNDEPRWGGECLVIQPGNDNEIWAGSRGDGLRHSTDAGANWSDIAPATFHTPNVVISGITIHPSAPDTIWICGDGGVWVSTNHGANWSQKISATRIYRVAVKADGTAFAAGTNAGSNVLYRFTIADSVTNLYPNYTAALPYAPGSDLAMVQLLANNDLWAADLFNFTARSTDAGNTFTNMPMTLTGTLPAFVSPGTTSVEGGRNGLVQDPTNASRLFLGGGYSPFRSLDGGNTWSYMNAGIGETVAWRVSFHPTDANRIWLPLADLGCTTASDGGASGVSNGYIAPQFPYPNDNVMFTHRLLVSPTKVIAPGGEQSGHAIRIYQTTDNGASWNKLPGTGLPTANNSEILDAVTSADNFDDFIVFTSGVVTSSQYGIYRTTNGGANFTRSTGLTSGYDPGAEFFWNVSLESDATDNNTRYALLRNSGFWKSIDRGATWTKPATHPNGSYGRLRVDPVSHRIWVGHSFALEYSDDHGVSWTTDSGLTSVTELDAYNGRIAVIGQKSGDTTDHIYVSSDNGATFDEITRTSYRFANAAAVTVDPKRPGTIWISTGGRSVSRFTPWTPLEIWRNKYYGNPNATGLDADNADSDADGLSTFAEYAFGTTPTVAETIRPVVQSRAGNRLTVTFPRDTGATDLTMVVQGTDVVSGSWADLARSTAGAAFVALNGNVTVTETGAGAIRSVEVRDQYTIGNPAHPNRFLRVNFSSP